MHLHSILLVLIYLIPDSYAITITLILSLAPFYLLFLQQILRPTPAPAPNYCPRRLRPHVPSLFTWLWRPAQSLLHSIAHSLGHFADSIRSPQKPMRTFNRHTSRHYYVPALSHVCSARIGHKTRRYALRTRAFLRLATLLASPIVTYAFNSEITSPGFNFHIDSDSFAIKVDNCASRCITNDPRDFVHPPTRIRASIRGLTGSLSASHQGTIQWNIEDDNGHVHELILPGSYLVKEAPFRLLSPQHWGQSTPSTDSFVCITTARDIKLQWGDSHGGYQKTIPLDLASNTATLFTAPGLRRARAFCATFFPDDTEADAFPTVISDDERSVQSHDTNKSDESQDSIIIPLVAPLRDDGQDTNVPSDAPTATPPPPVEFVSIDFGVHPEMPLTADQEEVEPDQKNPTQLWVFWHHKLGHLPDKRLRQLARNGDLPSTLLSVQPPPCASCLYGKATRKAWRTKAKIVNAKTVTAPGQVVSIDQLESPTPGFIAQMKGSLTTQRYRVATIFVDHFSDLGFVFLQRSTTAVETLQAKHAFERFASSHSVIIRHYHADNGRFAERAFVDDVEQKGQTITFCGVSAHHQNGKAEKRIRDLQDAARTMLIHAYRRWPKGITVNLWPHALRTANDVRNCAAARDDGLSPMSVFTGVPIQPQLRHFHPFGCPVYVLATALQNKKKIPKWNERSRIGIYLGHSPSHARNVSLVLNLLTGLVSPQFHVQHDEGFATIRDGSDPPTSFWQQLAGFGACGNPKLNRTRSVQTNEGELIPIAATEPEAPPPNAAPTDVPPAEGVADIPVDDPPLPVDDNAPLPDNDAPIHLAPPGNNGPIAQPTRRSSRTPVPSRRLLESLETAHIAFEAQVMLDLMQELDIDTIHPFAFAASNDLREFILENLARIDIRKVEKVSFCELLARCPHCEEESDQ